MTHNTREEWLVAAVEALGRDIFAPLEIAVPPVRVSVGWPGGSGKKSSVIGQCWKTTQSDDKVAQVFISPSLVDRPAVLETLVHELIHAVDDCESGHKGEFVRMAKRVGLTGKMTSTVAGEELAAQLVPIAETLGEYPHAKLSAGNGVEGPKKQGTRMIKVICPDDGYTLRTTKKWIEVGVPTCPCGTEMEVA